MSVDKNPAAIFGMGKKGSSAMRKFQRTMKLDRTAIISRIRELFAEVEKSL